MAVPGQRSLSNFYESVRFASPAKADAIHGDVMIVAMYGLSSNKSDEAKQAADRLRRAAFDLPVIQARVLDSALADLGY